MVSLVTAVTLTGRACAARGSFWATTVTVGNSTGAFSAFVTVELANVPCARQAGWFTDTKVRTTKAAPTVGNLSFFNLISVKVFGSTRALAQILKASAIFFCGGQILGCQK